MLEQKVRLEGNPLSLNIFGYCTSCNITSDTILAVAENLTRRCYVPSQDPCEEAFNIYTTYRTLQRSYAHQLECPAYSYNDGPCILVAVENNLEPPCKRVRRSWNETGSVAGEEASKPKPEGMLTKLCINIA